MQRFSWLILLFPFLSSPALADDPPPIRLGHYGSMSGSLATFGESTDRSIRLAVAEANARGGVLGRRVEVFTEDDQSNPDQVLRSVLELIGARKVDVVLGEVSSRLSLLGAPLCQEKKVPMVTPSSAAVAITAKGDYIFRMCFIDAYQGQAAAVFSARDLKARRAAILVDQKNDYSVGVAAAFRAKFVAMGGRIVAEKAYLQGDRDYKSQLSAIGEARPDVILVPAMYNDVPGIAQQARGLGISAPLIGGDGWDSADLLRDGGKNVEGYYFITHYAPDAPEAPVRAFQKAYRDLYAGQEPDGMGALAFDAARIVLDAIRRAGSTDAKAIRDALAATRAFPGITGTITMGPDRNPSKSAMVIRIKDGAFRLATTVEAADVARDFRIDSGSEEVATGGNAWWAQPLANGLSLGAIYGLIALGYTIVYGILRLINFAHGDLVMLAPLLIFGMSGVVTPPANAGASAILTLAVGMVLCGLAGLALERVAYRPLRQPYGWTTILVITLVLPVIVGAAAWMIRGGKPEAAGLAGFVVIDTDDVLGHRVLGLSTAGLVGVAAIGTAIYGLALILNRLADHMGVKTPGRLIPLITAIGVSLFLESVPRQRGLFGNRPQAFPAHWVANVLGTHAGPLRLGGAIVDRIDVLVLGVTAVLLVALMWIVKGTRLGLAMRAVSGNPDAAALMGINADRVIRACFVLGGSLAGAAGVLWATKYPTIDPQLGVMPGLKAFVAAVLGGIGSLPGAVLGGIILGVCEAFLASGPLSQYKDALAFLLLIGILLVRPAGLLGRNLPEKV